MRLLRPRHGSGSWYQTTKDYRSLNLQLSRYNYSGVMVYRDIRAQSMSKEPGKQSGFRNLALRNLFPHAAPGLNIRRRSLAPRQPGHEDYRYDSCA
jgi:hypothetical protein